MAESLFAMSSVEKLGWLATDVQVEGAALDNKGKFDPAKDGGGCLSWVAGRRMQELSVHTAPAFGLWGRGLSAISMLALESERSGHACLSFTLNAVGSTHLAHLLDSPGSRGCFLL